MLYRNFYRYVDASTLLKMYKSIIRPHLEYACVIWDPHLAKDVKSIENTQKFALRVCNKSWGTCYEELLTTSSLTTMARRRSHLKLCMFFNIINQYISYPNPPFSKSVTLFPNRHANKVQLSVPFARTNIFKFSFFPSTINAWNTLEFDCTTINSLNSFKCALLNHNHI